MLLDHYVSAMDSWKGRIDSETDYDAFRWHQWVQPIDLNDGSAPFTGKLGFAFIGFCSDKGVARNKGRTGTALAPDFVRGQMSGLPCTFSQAVQLYDAAGGAQGRTGSAVLYVIGGTLAFFVNDVAQLVSNTTGMNVTLSNVCTIMGGS